MHNMQSRAARARAAGLCQSCYRNDAPGSDSTCLECRHRQAKYRERAKDDDAFCVSCAAHGFHRSHCTEAQ